MEYLEAINQLKELDNLRASGNIDEAIAIASEIAVEFPQAPDIQYITGKLFFERGDIVQAKFHLQFCGNNINKNEAGFIEVDDLLPVLQMLARCGDSVAANLVSQKNLKNIDFASMSFSEVKSLVELLVVIEDLDNALLILNNTYPNFDNEKEYTSFLLLMATVFQATDQLPEEFEVYQLALESDPLNEQLHSRLSRFLGRLSEHEMASEHIKFIQKINPDYQFSSVAMDFFNVCKSGSFEEQEQIKNFWLNNPDSPQESRAPFAALLLTDDPEFLLNDAKQFSTWASLIKNKGRKTDRPQTNLVNGRKIRLGYVSPDFRDHAVCHLINDLIATHDRDQFEVYGYGVTYTDLSPYQKQIENNFDQFYHLELEKTHTVKKQIEADQIDICIDLAGYTAGFVPTLFNRLEGPILVNYLGYPGTLGHPQYDYIIGDPIVTPASDERFFSEKIIRLDCCYQPNSPSKQVSAISRDSTGLPDDVFVFCNFNTRQKLNKESLMAWGRLVSECPDSILWLLNPGDQMKAEILTLLAPIRNRIYFADSASVPDHLGRIKHANLFLDSFPYGAHTTASDAIFNGIPILAREGRSFQSRVAKSLMHFAGAGHLSAPSWEDFFEKGRQFYSEYPHADITNMLLDFKRDRHPYNINWTRMEIERAFKQMLA